MSWSPILGSMFQYSKEAAASSVPASGYVLKLYNASNVAIQMASARAGSGLLSDCVLDSSGYPLNGSSDRFAPFVDQEYKVALYSTQALADANSTASAEFFVGPFLPFSTLSTAGGSTGVVSTMAALKAVTGQSDGEVVIVNDYATAADNGGGSFEWLASDTTTSDDGFYVQPDVGGAGRWKRKLDSVVRPQMIGVTGDGSTDDSAAMAAFAAYVVANDVGVIDFGGPEYTYKILQDSGVVIDTGSGVHGWAAVFDFASKNGLEIRANGCTISVGRDYTTSEVDVIFRFDQCKNIKFGTFRTAYTGTRSTIFTGGFLLSLKNSNENIECSDQYVNDFFLAVGDYPDSRLTQTNYWSPKHFRIWANNCGYPFITDNGGTGIRLTIQAEDCGRAALLQDIVDAKVIIHDKNFTASTSVGVSGTIIDVEVDYNNLDSTISDVSSKCLTFNFPAEFNTDYTVWTGTHDGEGNASALTDTTEAWTVNALIGMTCWNKTDGSWGLITANTATTVTVTLSGGTDNDFDVADAYQIGTPHRVQNLSLSSHVETFNGAYLGYPLFMGVGTGAVSADIEPSYLIDKLNLSCTLKTDDAVNQKTILTQIPTSWSAGRNMSNIRIHDTLLQGGVLENLGMQGVKDNLLIDNYRTDQRMQLVTNAVSQTTCINVFADAITEINSNTNTHMYINCNLPDTSGAQSVINKKFKSCVLNGGYHDTLDFHGQAAQSFTVIITNTGGVLQHQIVVNPADTSLPTFAGNISGASGTLANTPSVGAGTDFISGVGIMYNNTLVFNTGANTSINQMHIASIEYYDGNVSTPTVYPFYNPANINGTTTNRLYVRLLHPLTAAAWTINTTNIPTGKSLAIKYFGYFA